MTIAYVGGTQTAAWSGATSATLAYSSYTAVAGNCLIAFFTYDPSGGSPTSITDTQSNSWTIVATANNANGQSTGIAYALNVTGGATTVTIHFSAATAWRMGTLTEYSGVATTSAADGHSANFSASTGAGTDSVSAGSVTTTVNADLIFCGVIDSNGGNGTYVSGTGFTRRLSQANMAVEDKVQTTSGAVSGTFTGSSSSAPQGMILALKDGTPVVPTPSGILFGSTQIKKVMYGAAEIMKVYFGSSLVYTSSTPVPSGTWGAALTAAHAGTGVARVATVGDSILEGEGATTTANRCIAKFVAGVRTAHSIAGASPGMSGCFHNTNLTESASWRNPLSASSGLAHNAWFSTQAKRGADFNSPGNYAQWTVTCDSFDVIHLQGTGDGGTLSVSVDGGAATVIDTSSGSALLCSQVTHINIGTLASHTIKVTLTAGAAAVDGILPYSGDFSSGVVWWDGADYGDTSANFMDGGTPVQPIVDLGAYNPHLIIDNIVGTSDYGAASLTPTQVAANLTARLNVYNSLPALPTVLFMATYQINNQLTTANSLGYTMQQYFDACKTAAQSGGAKWLDLNVVYPTFASNSGWLASDNGHPSDTGHQKIADALLSVL